MNPMSQNTYHPFGARVARAYSLAVAFPDGVPDYVQQNSDGFAEGGGEIRFGEYFIERLRAKALSGPLHDEVYGEAMRIAGEAGAPEFGSQLANDFMQDRTDMLLLADYLESLLDAMTALREGDTKPYQNTTLYQTMSFVWLNAGGLVLPGFLEKLQQMAFELNEWYVRALMDTIQIDFMEQDWPRYAAKMAVDIIDKYEDAKAKGDSVQMFLYSAGILGITTQYAPILGLTEEDISELYSEFDVDPLLEFLKENDWLP